jgi:DNA-binding IclR family transcriptional regulator
MAKPESPGRSVTSKVFALLDAFEPSIRELSLNELSRRSGLPTSTAYRLASELVERGAMERESRGSYRIGLRLWEIGSLCPRGLTVRDVALPFMQELHKATQENVHLAVLDGYEALYITRISGRRSVPTKARIGQRLPLHATAVGKVLLANQPREFLHEIVSRGLTRYTPHTIVAPGQLRRTLAEIRRTGVGFSREELTLGTVAVASPILDANRNVAAALSVVVRTSGVDLARLAPGVRMAAMGISRENRVRGVIPEGEFERERISSDGARSRSR